MAAEFQILIDKPGEPLIIRDTGHASRVSVTNDAEQVVRILAAQGRLPDGRRLLYFDSDKMLDEILVEAGAFRGFKPGPDR